MRKYRWLSTLACIGCSGAIAAGASTDVSTYSCEYEIKNRGTAGWATVELKGGEIQKISFQNAVGGGPGQPSYTCWVDASRDGTGISQTNTEVTWKKNGRSIKVEFKDASQAGDSHSMIVTRTSRGFLLDMRDTQTNRMCGAGAALPESVLVPITSKKCSVKL